MKKIMLTIMIAAILPSCDTKKEKAEASSDIIIGKKPIEVKDKRLSAEILQTLGQVSSPSVSPDGKTVAYAVAYTDIALNRRNKELFTVGIDGSGKRQITTSPQSESEPQWVKNGQKIAFLYNSQIWEMNPDGSERTQISRYDNGIDGFKYSPNGEKILFISAVKTGRTSVQSRHPDLDKATGRIIDDLMYKHWDEWVETVPHPFIADYDGKNLSNIVDIMEGEPFESPMKPFGGVEQLDWSPNSRIIAYTSRKKIGKEYAVSTNSDIYFYHTETKKTTNMTEGMMGYDVNPKFSPDGKYMAWQSMERDGYESDKNRLFVMNLATGEKYNLTENFDYNADDFCWGGASSVIYMLSNIQGTSQFFSVDFSNVGAVMRQITRGQHDYASIAYAGGYLIGLRQSMSAPNEVYVTPTPPPTSPNEGSGIENQSGENISQENTDILSQITMGKVESRQIKTTDNKEMQTWVIYPPDFDPNKKYPALLFCEGGPQNTVSQFWSLRWNFQIMAAHGYIVVAPNRRGVPGFGQAWCEQISGDYGGQNMKDYLSAIDALAQEPYVDETRLGCTGASYGGFSVYWLAGNHNKRFKAFWAHAGIFNLEAKYLETDELWFPNWDLGGSFWDKSNKTAQSSYAASPHRFVDKWDTPIAISCGELDYRILASQGMMAFNAAQLRGIPSRMLIFPNENHWILQPQNGVLFQREFFRWFDGWLK
ncbi:MAG: S9 family peptidase [Dysgonamonadaceae bacterium]|jgi:dipeptidyl aminopeptidase/acylaminoacyl peptidase|nr:S9 family peptidase [Dysgonamonadaceae bacterium]